MLQAKSEITQGTRNVPPPLLARMRGKRQMLPVPTAMLSMAKSKAQREEKDFCSSIGCVALVPFTSTN